MREFHLLKYYPDYITRQGRACINLYISASLICVKSRTMQLNRSYIQVHSNTILITGKDGLHRGKTVYNEIHTKMN